MAIKKKAVLASTLPDPSLGALAARALTESDGDRLLAGKLLTNWLRDEPEGQRLIERALGMAASNAIAGVIAYRRRRLLAFETLDRSGYETRAVDRASNGRVVILASARLSEFPLPSGKRLGQATRAEVEDAVQVFRSRADTLMSRADWLSAVLQRLPPGRTVLEVMSESDLETMADGALHYSGPPLLASGQ